MRIGLLAMLMAASSAQGATWYIATSGAGGSDSNAGSIAAPFASFAKAQTAAAPGDTIYVRGGTYQVASQITFNKAGGTASLPFKVFAYPGDATPVIDFATNPSTTNRGISIESNYWHVKGMIVQNAPDNGINISSSNNIVEQMVARNNKDSGVQISASGTRVPSNNLILNTDSYSNYDAVNHGENADGFAVKFRNLGPGNVLRGVRAWGNSDDGFDFWEAENGVTVENSWSFKNGINTFGDGSFAGDGNGIKLGKDSGTHILRNMVVWSNPANGVDINGNANDITQPTDPITHGVQVYNVTAYANGGKNFRFDEAFAHILKNNASLAGGSVDQFGAGVVNDHNSWNGASFATETGDFFSVSDTGAIGPRQADGSLPELGFLRLKSPSNLINAGVAVGTSTYGAAADLGAYEWITPGDVNKDGKVNTVDFNLLAGRFGAATGALWKDGNFDYDGDVDSTDFNSLAANYGLSVPVTAPALGAITPEPSGGVVLVLASLVSARRVRASTAVHAD